VKPERRQGAPRQAYPGSGCPPRGYAISTRAPRGRTTRVLGSQGVSRRRLRCRPAPAPSQTPVAQALRARLPPGQAPAGSRRRPDCSVALGQARRCSTSPAARPRARGARSAEFTERSRAARAQRPPCDPRATPVHRLSTQAPKPCARAQATALRPPPKRCEDRSKPTSLTAPMARIGRVVVGRGRDAIDVALITCSARLPDRL
jgi:hypothetical protein